ncbi:MAG: hypothetical protein GY821_16265, partial [Gammaproteobacteria bacterium]|nr:hypothetical protein [Gammaproteobacteria bacterium]
MRNKVQTDELEAQWQSGAQGGSLPGAETGPQGGPPGPQAPVVEFPDDHSSRQSVSQASEAVYPGDAASVEAKTLWQQSQIRQRPPSEITRVGIELTIPANQVGVPPRWGSQAYEAQYEFLHSKGFSKEKIIAELQRRVAEYDHLNMSFGQHLPISGLSFGRGTPAIPAQIGRHRSRSRPREKPRQVGPVQSAQRGQFFQQSTQTPYGRPPVQKQPFDPTGGLDTGTY